MCFSKKTPGYTTASENLLILLANELNKPSRHTSLLWLCNPPKPDSNVQDEDKKAQKSQHEIELTTVMKQQKCNLLTRSL